MSIHQTGLSFPFRVGVKGGAVMSTTSLDTVEHIEESIKQIILTCRYERAMEPQCYSSVESFVFSTLGESEKSLLKYNICEALKQDTRIVVAQEDITIDKTEDSLLITIKFRVKALDGTYVTAVEM